MQIKQYLRTYLKGQMILKELFDILEFSQKMNKQICFVCCEKKKANQTNKGPSGRVKNRQIYIEASKTWP